VHSTDCIQFLYGEDWSKTLAIFTKTAAFAAAEALFMMNDLFHETRKTVILSEGSTASVVRIILYTLFFQAYFRGVDVKFFGIISAIASC
jgi:hypothetical protein